MDISDIEKLAELARIEVSDTEKEALLADLSHILEFVDTIKAAPVEVKAESRTGAVFNVMRDDKDPHETGVYTEVLLKEAPDTENGFVKVKKIL